ncbi:hypothetical protein [Abyssalbus ytuae]|uniref:Uncharacterized protein n=1 Tax=Abyssalbus ytuae TaxID=2926907 RepID=A0A9E6ZJ97_9FLAO|nr:hypothetical protein [Abyssalbus ytuae]UOB16589.1 hypothetical protein MQE35_12690 [Abyssalbus ytuae]
MKELFLKFLPTVAAFMGFEPGAKEKLDFSEEEKKKLDAETGKDGFAEQFMKYYNEEYLKANEEAQKHYDEFMEKMKASGVNPASEQEEDPEPSEVPTADEKTLASKLRDMVKQAEGLLKTNAQLAADNEKLKKLPEDDVPEALITQENKKMNSVTHSKTHLFASGNSWDSLERPWNKRAASGKIEPSAATVWDKVNIDKLNEDLGAYYRRNSNEIMSLLMDGYDIPAHWPVVSNVQDQYVFTSIVSGEITQAFKKEWLPKNKQRFVPVINKIFDKQIDGEWQASELKSIEKSWLNMFFNEGSTPYKESFARYLIGEILKKARKEDKISVFKGVYSDPALQPDKAGSFLNSMDGFLKLISKHMDVDYKSHDLPKVNSVNAYDVIQDWVENKLPIDVRNMPGLKLGLGNDVHRWYIDGREKSKGVYMDYERIANHVEDFPNIEFVKHAQLEGTGFMYITTDDNIGLMVDRPGEEGIITIEYTKRIINFFADYKLGVFFKAFGAKVDPSAEIDYEDQIFFSNKVDLLTDVYVPVAANDATPSVTEHKALKIGSNNTAPTNITDIDDATVGDYIYLYGDAETNISTVVSNSDLLLDGGNFPLNKGNVLVLIAVAGDKFLEYSRTIASEASSTEKVTLAGDATTADAQDGTHFVTSANSGATALTNIENAIEGETYTIEGGSDTNSTTVANSGNFLLTGSFTASNGTYLKVVYNGAKFVEVERG